MKLTLRIDNFDSLPDGGPLSYSVEDRGFEAGRDTSLDWSLPDPNRFVSSRHLEIRYEQGRYWLYDVSTNGTFVNGGSMRVKSPHQLEDGDRLQVGHYVIVAELSDGAVQAPADPVAAPEPRPAPAPQAYADTSEIGMPAPARRAPASADIWSLGGAAPAPVPPLDPARNQPPPPVDFGSQHIASPSPAPAAPIAEAGANSPFGAMPSSGSSVPVSPPPEPQPRRASAAPPAPGGIDAALLQGICEGAGIRPEALTAGDPAELGREIGRTLRIVAEDLANLLKARAATKQSVKSSSRTMIGNTDNNPLKFVPSAEEALEVMYGNARPGFQRGAAAVKTALDDIKRHQYGVHAAIQPALAQLLEGLSPEAIEGKIGTSMLSSKKSKAWELFVERWDAMTAPYDNGMLDVFLAYFSDAYDAATRKS